MSQTYLSDTQNDINTTQYTIRQLALQKGTCLIFVLSGRGFGRSGGSGQIRHNSRLKTWECWRMPSPGQCSQISPVFCQLGQVYSVSIKFRQFWSALSRSHKTKTHESPTSRKVGQNNAQKSPGKSVENFTIIFWRCNVTLCVSVCVIYESTCWGQGALRRLHHEVADFARCPPPSHVGNSVAVCWPIVGRCQHCP